MILAAAKEKVAKLKPAELKLLWNAAYQHMYRVPPDMRKALLIGKLAHCRVVDNAGSFPRVLPLGSPQGPPRRVLPLGSSPQDPKSPRLS